MQTNLNRTLGRSNLNNAIEEFAQADLRGEFKPGGKPLSIEESDEYEMMEKCFRDKVPKTHVDVRRLMDMYKLYKCNPLI